MADFIAVAKREPLRLKPPLAEKHKASGSYRPAKGLLEALDVAMMLGVPLLLTGEPGTGKTRAAYWLASELGLPAPQPLRFDVKSASIGRDLLYSFDEVARFRDGAAGETRPLVDYLQLNALGEAIVRAAGGGALLTDLAGRELAGSRFRQAEPVIRRAFGPELVSAGSAHVSWLLPHEPEFAETPPLHCAVLIDELDKAPRDTPNDLLAEIENMGFAIPELGVAVRADPEFRPIAILTSNSEKALPEPFLRRCAYFDIPFPENDELAEIVNTAIASLGAGDPLVRSALPLFRAIRNDRDIGRKPGTAELLAWIHVMVEREGLSSDHNVLAELKQKQERLDNTLGALLKSKADIEAGKRVLRAEAAKD
jgi:MoxR-like ATPase